MGLTHVAALRFAKCDAASWSGLTTSLKRHLKRRQLQMRGGTFLTDGGAIKNGLSPKYPLLWLSPVHGAAFQSRPGAVVTWLVPVRDCDHVIS